MQAARDETLYHGSRNDLPQKQPYFFLSADLLPHPSQYCNVGIKTNEKRLGSRNKLGFLVPLLYHHSSPLNFWAAVTMIPVSFSKSASLNSRLMRALAVPTQTICSPASRR